MGNHCGKDLHCNAVLYGVLYNHLPSTIALEFLAPHQIVSFCSSIFSLDICSVEFISLFLKCYLMLFSKSFIVFAAPRFFENNKIGLFVASYFSLILHY